MIEVLRHAVQSWQHQHLSNKRAKSEVKDELLAAATECDMHSLNHASVCMQLGVGFEALRG